MTFVASSIDTAQDDLESGAFSQSGFNLKPRSDQLCAFMNAK
jgi:hypothetical protein